MSDYSYLRARGEISPNTEWAAEVRTRLADLNELLEEAAKRDVIITGSIAMPAYAGGESLQKTIQLTLSERI